MDRKEKHAKKPFSINHQRFSDVSQVNLADRTYGFMRINTQKVHTPYPRAKIGIDANLLNARLEQEQLSRKRDSSKRSVSIVGNVHDHKLTEKRSKVDSPYPMKGVKLDRESLIKSILPLSESESQSTPHLTCRRPTPTPADTPVNSLQEASDTNSRQSSRQESSCSKTELFSPMFREERRDRRSFHQRRKDFYEAEYTIAKDGIKMSDYSVHLPKQPKEIEDKITFQGYDLKAKEEIDIYIQNLGLQKLTDNVLKHTGMLRNLENRKTYFSEDSFGNDDQ